MVRVALLMLGWLAATGTAAELRVSEGSNFALALSPDARELALDLQGSLQLLPVGGGPTRLLTDGLGDDRLPAWSPDGGRLAFQSFRDGRWQIFSLGRDGQDLRQHTTGPAHAREPVWSADGRELIFSSDRAGNLDLWAVNFTGGGWRALTSDPGDDYLPAMGADGSVWFVSDRDGAPAVWRRSADGEETPLANKDWPPASGLSLSPDGQRLSWITTTQKIGFPAAARHAVVVYELAEGMGRTLVNAGSDVFPFAPQWRDNSTLLYSADGGIRQRRIDRAELAQTVPFSAGFSVDARKPEIRSALKRRTAAGQALGLQSPLAGPDGSVIFTALGDIWQRSSKGALKRLTNDPAVERDLSLAANDDELFFITDHSGRMQIWSLALDSGNIAAVSDATGVRFPSLSPDGQQLAYLQVGPRGTQDFSLRILDRISGKTRRLRAVPGLWPQRMAWSADSEHLLVTVLQPASARFRAGSNVLLRVDVAADRSEALDDLPILDEGVAVSARGDRLALVSNGRLWALTLSTDGRPMSQPRRLVNQLVSAPAWGRDGQTLLVLGPQGLSTVSRRGRLQPLPLELPWREAVNTGTLLVHAGRLFSGHGEGYRAGIDIRIENGRIEAVFAHRDHDPSAQVIDAGDATVLPGLIDHHAHFEAHQGGWIGRAWLAFGVTSVVEPGGLPYASRALMEAWDSGKRAGPRLFFAGPQLDGERKFFPFASHIRDDKRLQWEFARGERLGYAMVKTYTHMPVARQQAAIRAARRAGLPLSSHELFPALGLGASRVEHLRGSSRLGYSSKQTALLRSYADVISLAAASGGSITPTLVVSGGFFDYLGRHPQLNDLPQYQAFYDKRYRGGLTSLLKLLSRRGDLLPTAAANARRAVRDYHRAGVTIVAGTDSPIFPYGLALIVELASYVEAGLRPAEALRTATINAAAALGADGELGVIAPGARADLIIVDGDPLSRMEDLLQLRGSLRGGIYYPLEQLLQTQAVPTSLPAK